MARQLFYGTSFLRTEEEWGVEEVQPTVIFPSTHTLNSEGEHAPYYAGGAEAVMFIPEDSAKILDSYRIVGEMPEVGSVAIAGQMAPSCAGPALRSLRESDISMLTPS